MTTEPNIFKSSPTVQQQLKKAAERFLAVFAKTLTRRSQHELNLVITGKDYNPSYLNIEIASEDDWSGSGSGIRVHVEFVGSSVRVQEVVDPDDGSTYLLYSKAAVEISWPAFGAVGCDKTRELMSLWSLVAEVASNVEWELNQAPYTKRLIMTKEESDARERVRREQADQKVVNLAVQGNVHRMRVGSEKAIEIPSRVASGEYVTRIEKKVYKTRVNNFDGMSGTVTRVS